MAKPITFIVSVLLAALLICLRPRRRVIVSASNGDAPQTLGYLAPVANDAWRWRQFRFNPLRFLTPQLLTMWLDQWDSGYTRNLAVLLEQIEERDDMLAVDVAKRKEAVASRGAQFQVVMDDTTSKSKDPSIKARAEKQKQAVQYFFKNVTVSDSTDLDQRGGMRLLVRYMMGALFQRKSAFEIIWKPCQGGLTATFNFVPLYFFEETRGTLRYTGPVGGLGRPITGNDPNNPAKVDAAQDLNDGEWFIARANGWIGKALTICQMYKAMALRDLVNLSQRFGTPWVHGETPAAFGSPEFKQFEDALYKAANDAVIATSIMPGSIGETKINLLTPSTGSQNVPMEIVEMMNRRITSLCRGADLATASRRTPNVGASVQNGEGELMEKADCEWASDELTNSVVPHVIKNACDDDEVLVRLVISPSPKSDVSNEIEQDTFLLQSGVPITVGQLADRYHTELPVDSDPDELAHAPTPTGQSGEEIAKQQQAQAAAGGQGAANSADQPRDAQGRWTPDSIAKAIELRKSGIIQHSTAAERHYQIYERNNTKAEKYHEAADKMADGESKAAARIKGDAHEKLAQKALAQHEEHMSQVKNHREKAIELLGIQKSMGASNDISLDDELTEVRTAIREVVNAPESEFDAKLLDLRARFPGISSRLMNGSALELQLESEAADAMEEQLSE